MLRTVLILTLGTSLAACQSITGSTSATSDTFYGDYVSGSITGRTGDYYCTIGGDRYEKGLTNYDRDYVRCGKSWRIK